MLDGQTALDAFAECRRQLIQELILTIKAGAAARQARPLVTIHTLASPEQPDSAEEPRVAAGAGM